MRQLLVIALLAAPGVVSAFHDDGVGSCDGCHLTHEDGTSTPVVGPDSAALLNQPTASEVCLQCHAQGGVLGNDPLAPPPERGAGNFVFLLEDNLNDSTGGAANPIHGDAAGHNLDAPGYGLTFDSRYSLAPGGTFPANLMSCTSCHDPHGNSSFRMLYGAGVTVDGSMFSRPAPMATGIALEGAPESRSNHTAYLAGMSEWCGNCHGNAYHDHGGSAFEHESPRALGGSIAARYNEYDGASLPAGGSQATAYLPDVPFEDASSTTSSTTGPTASSRVMCLSCHRAHASSAPAAGRWDFNVTLLNDDGVVSGSYAIPNPYPDPAQGSLCAKCHEGTSGGSTPPYTVPPIIDPTTGTLGDR